MRAHTVAADRLQEIAMTRLWTDGPPTQTYAPPPTPPQPPYAEMPAAPPPPPRDHDRRGRWVAAFGGGTVSAVLVAAVLLGTGIGDDGNHATPVNAGTQTPVSVSSSDARGNLVRTIYAAASPSVVSVRTGEGSGTGFLVNSDGTIVTNAHVVGNNSEVQVRFTDDGDLHTARVLGVDESTDLAAIKVDASAANGVKPLQLADSDKVQVGDTALAIGYPLGLDRTATAGIISGLGRDIQAPNGFSIDKVIQTDAPINPGNSGGPLLNSNGEVIGINSQIATAGGGNGSVGIGFAIPANTVKEVLPQLERGAQPQHPYLGVSTAPTQNGGAQVGETTPGGPAAKAGIQPGDVIVQVGGERVQDPADVATAIENNKPGDKVDVKVERNGSEHTIQVTLGQRPDQLPGQQQP
jgi:putative serine protease PepD